MGEDPMKAERDRYDRSELDYSRLRRVQLRRAAGSTPLSTFAVRLEAEVIDELRRVAAERGVGATQLAREWILERLAAESDEEAPKLGSERARPALGLSETELVATLRPLVQEIVAEELGRTRTRRVAPAKRASVKRPTVAAPALAKRTAAKKAPARERGRSTAR